MCRLPVSGHNKPKLPKPKRRQTETAINRKGHKPKQATDWNGHKQKRPQGEKPQTIRSQGTYFKRNLIKIQTFLSKKMHSNASTIGFWS